MGVVAACLLAALDLLRPAAASVAIAGRVAASSGIPVERARVAVLPEGPSTLTDSSGRFALPGVEPPVRLAVTHPRFMDAVVEVTGFEAGPLEITLDPKLDLYERVVVTASPGEEGLAPVSFAAQSIRPEEAVEPPSTLLELLEEVPGVAENGQGGIFQVYSIRGVSRFRVMTLVSGIQVITDRRAGVSLSFLDPLLIGSAEIVRGPASTHYGSGALGGVVQVFPREFDRWWAAAGYRSQGDETFQAAGWGQNGLSVGLALRRAGNGETAKGEPLDSRFETLSATLSKRWELSPARTLDLLLIPALAADIGKASTDFPERTTTYPRERHLLARLSLRQQRRWTIEAWTHFDDLHTRVEGPGAERSDVFNEAVDFGARAERRWIPGRSLSVRVGLDYLGRRGVAATEIEQDAAGSLARRQTLDGGRQDEPGIFGAVEWSLPAATLFGGARFSRQRQAATGRPSVDDSAWNGFLGAAVPLRPSLEFTASMGTGQRFATLSERFFSGTTGRGGVIGNPLLGSERSLSFEIGLRSYGSRLYLAGYAFRNRIGNYIERVEVAPDLVSFAPLTSGIIVGIEAEGLYQPSERWRLSWGGHLIEGEDAGGAPLADIPPARLEFETAFRQERWRAQAEWEHRFEREDPGSGEKAIAAADVVALSVAYRFRGGLELSLSASNLLDEVYFNSADEKVPHAPGRSFGLSATWTAP